MSPVHFLQITNLLSEAALLLAPDGSILAANGSAKRLLGSGGIFHGRQLAEFVSEPATTVAAYLGSCERTTGAIPGRLTVCQPQGQKVPCQARGALLRDPDGGTAAGIFLRLVPNTESPSQFALLNRHIEDLSREVVRRVRAEEELARKHEALHEAHEALSLSNEELQSINEELVVANEELRSQQQELRRAGEHKDRFLAMLAHELRNPLAPVRTGIHVLSVAEPGSPVWERNRQTVERQVAHMSRLVNDLLDVSQMTTGKMRLRRTRLDLAQLVSETVEDFRAIIEAEGLALSVAVPSHPVTVTADPERVAQALVNLLENARKFTPIGGRVEVRLEVEGNFAVLQVRDTGIGISAEDLPYLFEPFTQAEQTPDRPTGGLGLGLALVKGIVDLHRGAVTVRSDGPAAGAQFTVRLHLDPASAPVTPTSGTGGNGTGQRVLIIEDNQAAAETLGDLLELYGHEVHLAYSGEDGVEAARELQPTVIISDVGLPGMSGYAVAEALRQDPALGGVRLIALTGYGGEDTRQKVEAAGFDEHLVKPAEIPTLLALLKPSPVRR